MGRMADTVLKQQNEHNRAEEERIRQAYLERERKEINTELEKKMKLQEIVKNNRNFLEEQVVEKKKRTEMEKLDKYEQAEMWNKDKQQFESKEEEKLRKIKEKNLKHADYLKTQVETKATGN